MKNDIMKWIDSLPGVEHTDMQERRDEIAAKMEQSAKLIKEAEELREEAYFESLRLESEARLVWSTKFVDALRNR